MPTTAKPIPADLMELMRSTTPSKPIPEKKRPTRPQVLPTLVTITFTEDDAVYLRDLLDTSRTGHMNRLVDWTLSKSDDAPVNAVRSANEAERCLKLRAAIAHELP